MSIKPLGTRPRGLVTVALAFGRISRGLGYNGQVLPGRVALAVRPSTLSRLADAYRTVLVSGTNGKTTTTALVAAALSVSGPVATNATGANMLDGVATTLMTGSGGNAVIEVDEHYVPAAIKQLRPAMVVLLNVSRDQLDRAGETRSIARRWRDALVGSTATVVANSDDPLVAWAAGGHANTVWVAAGGVWRADSLVCPYCAHPLSLDDAGGWQCASCGARRPEPAWIMTTPEAADEPAQLRGQDGSSWPLPIALPGIANRSNAAVAVAAAVAWGIPAAAASAAIGSVTAVAGRYETVHFAGHDVWLVLAKNPAGWSATLDMLGQRPGSVVISVNAAEPDGRDTSWLYDVPFERLAGRTVAAAGARAADVGVRLSYAGVPHTTLPGDPLRAIAGMPPGRVVVAGDYSSFRAASHALHLA